MLRFAEEIILLLLNDDDGGFVYVPNWSLKYALAGGVLMDLALENRIDTDLEKLVMVDATPVGDTLLDPTLADIEAGEERNARFWVERTGERAGAIREEALSPTGLPRHPGTSGRPLPMGVPVQTLPGHRR